MDGQLRSSRRNEAHDPQAWHRRAIELLRVGDVVAASTAIRPALCDGEPVAAEILDRLAPEAIDALEVRGTLGRAAAGLGPLGWCPGEEAVIVAQDDLDAPSVLRWELGSEGPVECLARPRWTRHRGLVMDPSGQRVALHGLLHGRSGWELVSAADGRSLTRVVSPQVETKFGRWCHAWWKEHLLCGTDQGELWCWDLETRPRRVLKAPELDLADGTILARRGREVHFYNTPFAVEPAAVIPFPRKGPIGSGWSGLVASAGQRVVFYDRDRLRITLWSAAGEELGGADVPALDGLKLVAVRPCSAGTVVALRFKQKKRIGLVDLRTHTHRWVDAGRAPRDLVWSPDGQMLALPSVKGSLELLR